MLNKILPLSIIAIYLVVPAFAEDTPDISSTDDGVGMCVEPILGTYTGPANLQADWEGNPIPPPSGGMRINSPPWEGYGEAGKCVRKSV